MIFYICIICIFLLIAYFIVYVIRNNKIRENEISNGLVPHKSKQMKIFIICIMSIFLVIAFFVIYVIRDNKIWINERYNELVSPVTEYLNLKYDEEMIIKEGVITIYDKVPTLEAYPVSHPEIEFRITYMGLGSKFFGVENGFLDDYLEEYAEWEAKTIIDDIAKNYITNYYCYTGIRREEKPKEILREYYAVNKKHLSWYDDAHLKELGFAGIRIYGYDESLVEKNICDPILLDILKLDFIVDRITFYLYENEEDKEFTKTYLYEYDYENHEYRLVKIDTIET